MRILAFASAAIIAIAPVAPVAAQSAAPVTAGSGDAAEAESEADRQVRCRRIAVTGSHIRRERVCKTVGEWRRLADRGNDVVRQQVENGSICTGGDCGRGN